MKAPKLFVQDRECKNVKILLQDRELGIFKTIELAKHKGRHNEVHFRFEDGFASILYAHNTEEGSKTLHTKLIPIYLIESVDIQFPK